MPLIPLVKNQPIADVPAPVLDRERRPTLDNSPVERGVSELAQSSRMPELPAEKLAAPYDALGSVGRAVTQAGSVVAALAFKQKEAQTDVQIAEADGAMDAARGDFESWKINNPDPAGWGAEWEKRLGSLRDSILENDKLNQGAREQIGLRLTRYSGQSMADVQAGAAKETFAKAKNAYAAIIERAIDEQDAGRFDEALKTGEAKGYFFPLEAEDARQRFKKTGEQKARQAKVDAFNRWQDFGVRVASTQGEAPALALLDSPALKDVDPSDKERIRNAIQQTARDRSAAEMSDLADGIISGSINSAAQIDALDSPHLTPQVREQAKAYLERRNAQSEEQDRRDNGAANYADLFTKVQTFTPGAYKDQKAMEVEAFKLDTEILRRVGHDGSGRLREILWDKINAKPPTKPTEAQRYLLERQLETQFAGKDGMMPYIHPVQKVDGKTGKPVLDANHNPVVEWVSNPQEQQQATLALAKVKQTVENWIATHPDDAKDLDKLNEVILRALPDGSRAKVFDRIRDSLNALPPVLDSAANAHGRVTSYGYAGDPTPDSNSRAGIGAFVPDDEAAKIRAGEQSDFRLRRGDLAVSPDVERELLARGVKPMGAIWVKLANGETRKMRWADRTRADLRGRFDFYSPGGRDPMDGTQVVAWQPAR